MRNNILTKFTIAAALGALPCSAGSFTFTTVADPASPNFTEVFGINSQGWLTGVTAGGANGDDAGFIYNGSTFARFIAAGTTGPTISTGLSGGGVAVGYDFASSGPAGYNGFIYNGSTSTGVTDPSASTNSTYLMGINDAGTLMAGYYFNASGFHGFTYNGTSFTTLNDPNAINSGSTYATAVNNNGSVGGYFQDASGAYQGFLYNGSTWTTLTDPNACAGCRTEVYGINNLGQAVGYYQSAGGDVGFLFTGGTFSDISDPLGNNTYAYGINDTGEIAGTFLNSNSVYAGFTAQASGTPEPGSLYLVLGGLVIGLGVLRKRSWSSGVGNLPNQGR